MAKFKGAFPGCKWCYGDGCLQCDAEREKAAKTGPKPLFVADLNSESDIKLLNDVCSAKALEKAFGPEGGGMAEVEENAREASILQCLRGIAAGIASGDTHED